MNFITGPVVYGLGAVAVSAGLFAGVQTVRLSNAKADHEKHLAADAKAYADAQIQARQNEQAAGARQAQLEAQYLKDQQNAKAQYEAVIAGLRAGTVRVRDRFRCPVRVPSVAGATSVRDGGEEGGFNEQDAEVALGISRDGDDAIRQLQACQALVASDRKMVQ